VTRRTAGRLVGYGSFLAMGAVFFVPLVNLGWAPALVAPIALVMGVLFGCGVRAIADKGWPKLPRQLRDLETGNAGLDEVVAQHPVRYTYRPDVDDTLVTAVAEVFPDRTTETALRVVISHRATRQRKAGVR
jgi:hypothetical protein